MGRVWMLKLKDPEVSWYIRLRKQHHSCLQSIRINHTDRTWQIQLTQYELKVMLNCIMMIIEYNNK